jgi:hypothetical protein
MQPVVGKIALFPQGRRSEETERAKAVARDATVRCELGDEPRHSNLLECNGDDGLVAVDAQLDNLGQIPLRPACRARGKAASVQENQNGQ